MILYIILSAIFTSIVLAKMDSRIDELEMEIHKLKNKKETD